MIIIELQRDVELIIMKMNANNLIDMVMIILKFITLLQDGRS